MDEGHYGTSDPQLYVYLADGGTLIGRTSVAYNTLTPVWPPHEEFCFTPDECPQRNICFEIRDDSVCM